MLAPRKHYALAFVSESEMLRIPFAHLITIRGFEEDTADSKDAAALLRLGGRFRFSGCGDCTSCPFERAAMSNSDPSAIVLHGIACIGGLYIGFDSNGEIGPLKVRRTFLDRALGL